MEMTFRREATQVGSFTKKNHPVNQVRTYMETNFFFQRQILFTEIATATTLPVDQVIISHHHSLRETFLTSTVNQVEMLIMKALAQGLVKGKIDEVRILKLKLTMLHNTRNQSSKL